MGIKVLQVNIQHWNNDHYFRKCSLSNNNPDVILLRVDHTLEFPATEKYLS